jgi:hypothetical protein
MDSAGWITIITLVLSVTSVVLAGLFSIRKGDNRRLVAIQHELVALIDELDPKRKYTAGYDLQPIELEA